MKLRLSTIEDDKPVKLSVELPAAVHRSLIAYAEAIGRQQGTVAPDPIKLVAPMLEKFMATDRAFRKSKKRSSAPITTGHQTSAAPIALSSPPGRASLGSDR